VRVTGSLSVPNEWEKLPNESRLSCAAQEKTVHSPIYRRVSFKRWLGGRGGVWRSAKRESRPNRGGEIDRSKQQKRRWHFRRDDKAAEKNCKPDTTPDRGPNVREKVVPRTDDVVCTNRDCERPYNSDPTILCWWEAESPKN
jgi:hypothetical protein